MVILITTLDGEQRSFTDVEKTFVDDQLFFCVKIEKRTIKYPISQIKFVEEFVK